MTKICKFMFIFAPSNKINEKYDVFSLAQKND